MPSSGSFVTMYLAELHFGNGYMEIGLLIYSLHAARLAYSIKYIQRWPFPTTAALASYAGSFVTISLGVKLDHFRLHYFGIESKCRLVQQRKQVSPICVIICTITSIQTANWFWNWLEYQIQWTTWDILLYRACHMFPVFFSRNGQENNNGKMTFSLKIFYFDTQLFAMVYTLGLLTSVLSLATLLF